MILRLFVLSTALIILSPQVAPAGINLSDFNLITTGNVTVNSDVQGRVLIGGTLNTNNFTFGGQLGNVSGGLTGPSGIFSNLGSGVTNPNNNSVPNAYYATKTDSGSSVSGASQNSALVASYTNGLANYLSGVSSNYANLTTAATLAGNTVNTSDTNQVTFNATSTTTIGSAKVAVFTLNASFFSNNYTVSQLNGVTAGETVLINVIGNPTSFGNLHFNAFQNNEATTLFNFETATQLNLITNLSGSILAPTANLNASTQIRGGIYVQSVSSSGEIDLPLANGMANLGFAGYVPTSTSVPEPATVVSTLTGLVMVGGVAWRRRRRRRQAA